jgi:ubiquitin carboxyl-terminal hydrolase 9/24
VNPDLFLIDENIAILQCAYEFLDILRKIFCGCHRCYKYYLLNDKAEITYEKGVTNSYGHLNFEEGVKKEEDEIDLDQVKDNISNRKNIVFGQFANFLNFFGEIGGFDALIDLLKAGNEGQEDKMPLDMISLLVAPFRQCNTIFSPTFSQHFTTAVREIVSQRLFSMTEKELKEIDKESVSRVLKDLKDFFLLSMDDVETAKFIELNNLNISLRFLKSTYLEKRLKGLQEIKTMISSIEYA